MRRDATRRPLERCPAVKLSRLSDRNRATAATAAAVFFSPRRSRLIRCSISGPGGLNSRARRVREVSPDRGAKKAKGVCREGGKEQSWPGIYTERRLRTFVATFGGPHLHTGRVSCHVDAWRPDSPPMDRDRKQRCTGARPPDSIETRRWDWHLLRSTSLLPSGHLFLLPSAWLSLSLSLSLPVTLFVYRPASGRTSVTQVWIYSEESVNDTIL